MMTLMGVTNAQSNSSLDKQLSDVFGKANKLKNDIFALKSLTNPSDEVCSKSKNDVIDFYNGNRKFSDDVQAGLRYENDRNFVRLDMFTTSVKLGDFATNALTTINYICNRSNPYANDFANIYYEIMEDKYEIAQLWLDKARKTYIN